MQDILIVGCGYTGLRLAIRLRDMGYRITGTARSEQHINAMHVAGIEAVSGELNEESTLQKLKALEPILVVYFVPPQKNVADPLPGILQVFRHSSLQAFIYAGATSVYGDRQGEWVDETTPVTVGNGADAGRIKAEQLVEDAVKRYGLPARICRISGIYGPGRTLKGLLQSGHYSLVEGHDAWVGRIHVDDLVTGIIKAWQRGEDGQVYNMVDQRPHHASEFANLAADLNGLPRPAWIDESEARDRYLPDEFLRKVSSKRIRCVRLIENLEVQLQYPTFEEGLPASVAEDRANQL